MQGQCFGAVEESRGHVTEDTEFDTLGAKSFGVRGALCWRHA